MSREVHLKLNADPKTNALRAINEEHGSIHEGDHFFFSNFEDENTSGTIELVITTPDTTKWGHFLFRVASTEKIEVKLYEGATTVAGGAAVTPINNNRNSINTSGMSVVKDPTSIGGDGTQIDAWSTGSTGPFAQLGHAERNEEIILKQNEKYLLRITSKTDNNTISYAAHWYEHVDLS